MGSHSFSAHLFGLTADFSVPGHSTAEVIAWARDHLPVFDQLIDEFGGWVHAGLSRPVTGERRKQVLHARQREVADKNKTLYLPGLETV